MHFTVIVARSLSNWPNSLVFPNDLSNFPALVWYSRCTVSCSRTSSTSSSVSFDGDDSGAGGNDSGGDSDEFDSEFLSCVLNKVMGCICLLELGVHTLKGILVLGMTGVDGGLWFVLCRLIGCHRELWLLLN